MHLTRDYVEDVMRDYAPEGFIQRNPTAHRIVRAALTSLGPHEEWSADGHDKLCKYGLAIWAVRDKFSSKWLGLWVMPNNRIALAIAYCWLSLVRSLGGMPIQTTTDCGSETTVVYGLANALREAIGVDRDTTKPAHKFLRSVHNIRIERGWVDFRQGLGHNVPHFWENGEGVYVEGNLTHEYLAKWLWPPLIQAELDDVRDRMNNNFSRRNPDKLLPSGCSPNDAYALYEDYGGEWCLQEVDRALVDEIMEEMAMGEDLLNDYGVPPVFAAQAKEVLETLNIGRVTLQNVWFVFADMLPRLEL